MQKEAQKIKQHFFASVAHELRTPLNTIIPILKMLIEKLKVKTQNDRARFVSPPPNELKNEEVLHMLQIVYNSSIHLSNVIEDMLDVTRIENKQFSIFKTIFDFRQAVNEVCEIMRFQLQQKKLGFEVKVAESVPGYILSDMKRVKQVLFNLIGNAVKFTFSGKVGVSFAYDSGTHTL